MTALPAQRSSIDEGSRSSGWRSVGVKADLEDAAGYGVEEGPW